MRASCSFLAAALLPLPLLDPLPACRDGRARADPDASVTADQDSLALTLVLPTRVPTGAPLLLQLVVENRATGTLDLYLRGREPTLDVLVTRPDGQAVWHRLADAVIPAVVRLRSLAPEERMTITAEWDQRTGGGVPLAPGEYVATGVLLVEGGALHSQPVSFRVLPD